MSAYLPSKADFRTDAELSEWLADRGVPSIICPPDAIAASRLEAMRNSVKTLLRAYEVAPPSDAFLDNLLTEMSELHDMPLDKPETWRREF